MVSNMVEMGINKLLDTFRGALKATVPWITQVGIRWKDTEAYDDWDNIATALYESIVCAVLEDEGMAQNPLPKYDLNYKQYKAFDFIAASSPAHQGHILAFVGFASVSSPLEKVHLAVLDQDERVIDNILCDLADLTFFFYQNNHGKREKRLSLLVNL